MSDLGQLKKDFSQLVLKVPQWTLTQFVLWLDLKVAEYKVNGYMVLDDTQRTLPRWIDDDILEAQETAPKHKHCRPCGGYKHHAKRRRKWKHWHGWGMPYGFDKAHHNPESIMNIGENTQDNAPVEISDESDNSDFEYVTMDMPHGSLATPGNEPQKLPLEKNSGLQWCSKSASPENEPQKLPFDKYSHRHWFSKFSPHRLRVPMPFNVTKRCSSDTTDSVLENVNQISISNEGVRQKQSLKDFPPCQMRNLLVGDNSSRNTSGTCTPESCLIDVDESERTVTSTAIAAPEAAKSSEAVPDGENHGKSHETEAMVIQESEEAVDIKPDIVQLDKEIEQVNKEGEDQNQQDDNEDDKKLEFDMELMPLSPVTSALMNYQGMKHCRRQSKLPIEQPARRQTNTVPNLLDDTTKRYLLAGHTKLVWNKVVAACASFLVHACKGQPSSSDYQWLCKTMYDRYSSLGSTKGPNPWSGFNRAVSQKIRHTRFKIKQMGKMSTSTPHNTCMFS